MIIILIRAIQVLIFVVSSEKDPCLTVIPSSTLNRVLKKPNEYTLRPNVQIRSYFWSVFSCIRSKYGDLQRKSLYSVQYYRKIRNRNKSVFRHFSHRVALRISFRYLPTVDMLSPKIMTDLSFFLSFLYSVWCSDGF